MQSEEAVLSFVHNSIRSAWALELLLLLQREPRRNWGAEALVHELRGSVALVTDSLAMLTSAGLVATDDKGEFAYWPRSPELAELVAGLVDLHARRPVLVLNTIFSAPSDKIRTFADAFLFKK